VCNPAQAWKASGNELSERVRIPEPGAGEKLPGGGSRERACPAPRRTLAGRHARTDRADDIARGNNL
jgi:hypothetical protein